MIATGETWGRNQGSNGSGRTSNRRKAIANLFYPHGAQLMTHSLWTETQLEKEQEVRKEES